MPAIALPKLGLRQQIMVLAILPFLVVVSATVLYMLYSYHQETHALDEQHVKRSARVVAHSARAALLHNQHGALQVLLDATLDREIIAAAVLSPEGAVLFSSGDFPNPVFGSQSAVWNDKNVSARWPIYRYGHTTAPGMHGATDPLLGWVVITARHTNILHNRHHTIAWGLLWALLSILLTIYLGGRVNHTLMTRILQLRDVINKLDKHQWSTRLPDSDYPDWQLLSEALNNLTQRTQQSFRKLQNEVDHSHRDLQRTLEHLEISNMELELARVEALSASQSKSEFLANTSHEVRTPLSGILGFCNVLLEHETNPRRREYLESIRNSAEHLLGVLNDILDLSKIEAGKFSLSMKPFALLPVIEDSARLFAQQAADKRLALVVDASPTLPRSVVGDPARLKQLVTNLISNAVKFTDHGEVVVKVTADTLAHSEIELRLTVQDTGTGIDFSQQKLLFEAFQQIDGSGTREHGGTGLGLAIVKRIAGLMNGQVTLVNSTPNGSTFELWLPFTVDEPYQPPDRLLTRDVLIWDENPSIQTAISHTLDALNIPFIRFDSLERLIDAASREHAIVVGFNDYHHFCNWEQKIPATPHRVVLLPSLVQVLTRQDFIFLQKPVPRSSLYDALHQRPTAAKAEEKISPQSPTQALAPTQVLAVDDNAANRLLIRALLDELSLPAHICESGRQAITHCQQERYPLIILDLQMPELSGAETARRIRETPSNAESYIVALTAHLADDEPTELQPVFNEMIEKPLTVEKLQELVDSSRPKPRAKPVSVQQGIARAGGRRDLARQLLGHFLSDLPATKDRWLEALHHGDLEAIARETHQLNGACSYVSAPALTEALQHVANTPQEKLAAAKEVINELAALIEWADNIDIDLLFDDDHR